MSKKYNSGPDKAITLKAILGVILFITVSSVSYAQTNAAGGWNGGGTGNNAYNGDPFQYMGGGGGGATDIRVGGTSLNNRIIVAGGGGGGGMDCGPQDTGGNGGGTTGGAGSRCGNTMGTGLGGTQVAGGGVVNYPGWSPAFAGTAGTGGNGGDYTGGGGGGGGYFGGGGGSWGGAGGGSSYAGNTCTNVVMTAGANTGNGSVIISGTGFNAQTFNFTGSVQTFTVPAGVTSISADLKGGSGGGGSFNAPPIMNFANGGTGARVTADIAVTPGQVLNIYVGQQGENGGQFTSCSLTTSLQYSENVSCNGGTNGAACVLATLGTSPYTYEWSNGETTATINNLSAGFYTATVTDAAMCTSTLTVEITEPSALSSISMSTPVLCHNGSDGTAAVAVSGGTMPYTYDWTPGGNTTDAENALTAGFYSCIITDSLGCTDTVSFNITEPDALDATENVTAVSCYGGSNGSAELLVTGGTLPYTYTWSNGDTTSVVSSLIEGTFTCTVTDNNGCGLTKTLAITSPDEILINLSVINEHCGKTDGSISFSATGGTLPYALEWNTSDTTELLSSLSAGNYNVQVTDANGCTAGTFTSVNNIPAPTASAVITDVSCYGNADGSVILDVIAGNGTASINWSNAATGLNPAGLTAGTYVYSITDSSGCIYTDSVIIAQPDSIHITSNVTPCTGSADGRIDITVSGGSPNYSFNWSTGVTDEDLTNLTAGVYTVTVTDQHNCTQQLNINVTLTVGLSETVSQNNISVFPNPSTGSFTVSAAATRQFILTDSAGRMITEITLNNQNAFKYSVNGLSAGIYYLKSITGEKTFKAIVF